MHFIHKCNIIHRDIKPSNILITENLEVKIADFGLSRSFKAFETEKYGKYRRPMSSSCFTRVYRPPEAILAKSDYDQNVDIWSMGCALYELYHKVCNDSKKPKYLFFGDSCYP